MAGGETQIYPRTHQPISGPSPQAQRNTESQSQVEIQFKDSKEITPCPGYFHVCPRRPSVPVFKNETHQYDVF